MHRHVNHEMVLFLCGEDLPDPANRVDLDRQHPDAYGLPGASTHYTMDDNGKRLGADMIRRGRELMEAAGATSVRDFGLSPVLGWHLMGTARMGSDPDASVVDANNRAHDVPNLFIADASSLATGGGVNPTHTIQAVALRCAEYLWTQRHTF
jgi:choline dehydrogenase-like flavoprotein